MTIFLLKGHYKVDVKKKIQSPILSSFNEEDHKTSSPKKNPNKPFKIQKTYKNKLSLIHLNSQHSLEKLIALLSLV